MDVLSKSIAPTQVIPKLDQLDRCETVNARSEHYSPMVAGSIPTGGKFFTEFISLCTMKDQARI